MTDRPVLAIDIGGTKLAAALVDQDGGLRRRQVVATGVVDAEAREALWQRVVSLVESVADDVEIAGVGVGCGGPMHWPAGDVSPLNIPAWREFPLRARLTAWFPDRPVRVHNDAIAMAVGEHWQGAGVGSSALLGVVVSTGVGGGLVLGGRVIDGATGNAGHVGHVVADPAGPACACGGRGCLEAVARGPAVVQWALQHGWQPAEGQAVDGSGLAVAARAGDRVALQAFDRAGVALGVALAGAASLMELDTVAVGGGLAQAGELLLAPARRSFARHAGLEFAAVCRILPAALGPDAGLIGAAALVLPELGYWGAD